LIHLLLLQNETEDMIIGWSPCLDSESTTEVRSIDGSVDAQMADGSSFDTADFTFEFSDPNYRYRSAENQRLWGF